MKFPQKNIMYLALVLLTSAALASSAVMTTEDASASNMTTTAAPKSVKEVTKEIESLVTYVTKMIMPYFVRNSDLKISGPCMGTFIKIFVDVRKLKLPAIKLLDAMAKPPFGMLRGHFGVMGDYDECLAVSSTKKGEVATPGAADEYYHGQYCTVEAEVPPKLLENMKSYGEGTVNITEFGRLESIIKEFPAVNFAGNYFKFHIGICLPSTCTKEDLTEILGIVPVDFVPLSVKRCEDGRSRTYKTDQLIFLAVLIFLMVLVLSGTVLDGVLHLKDKVHKGEHKDKFLRFLLAFSIYSNTQKFMRTEKNASSDIKVINGMYVLGTFLVVIYHTYFLPFFLLFSSNASNLGNYLKDFDFTLVVVMGISIEAYFLFSGLLLVYPRFRRGQKDVNINVIKIIVRRYIRLAPSVLFILGLIVVLPLFGSGPVFADIFDVAADNTRKWWYTYALMYNNFLEVKDQNFLYLWFIPCLMQISIVGSLLLWILAKWKRVGICLIIATGLGCNIALGVLTSLRKYPPAYAIYYYHRREEFEEPIYTAPLSHVLSYGIGMLLGYFMAKNKELKFSKLQVVVGWVVSLALTVGVQWISFVWRDGREADPIWGAVYGATHRTAFSLGLSWIILACTYGYGGALARILCWRGFTVLSKLGYFGYLIHYIVISFHVSMARQPIPFSHYENWMRICSYTVLTFFAAYILYVTFELPLTYVESLFLPSRPAASQPELPQNNNNNITQQPKGDSTAPVHFNNVHNDKLGNGGIVPTYYATIPDEHSKL